MIKITLLNEGLNKIRDLINADIDKGQLGTGTTASAPTDTGLETADATTLLALTSQTTADKMIKFIYTLPNTGGTTTTYTEFELQESATPTNYDRIVFTGLAFTSGGAEDIIITKKYFIQSI